ncbi:MAG: AarF/ABC1/UbiB kinase family protein [Eggerthellaceae bacterium]
MAIKVRRPHVVEQMTQDLALIRQAVALVGLTRATDGIKLSLDDLVTELERTTRQELDFCVEQHNLVRFRQFLDDQPGVESPRPYPHLSSDDVLVMDFVEGPMINDVPALRAMGLDPAKLGQRLAESFVTQIVDNGFFHADPHPGNILVRGDDIVWIDLGMVGQLSALERALIGRMFRAVAENDPYALMEALLGAVRSEGPVNHGRLLSQLGNLLVSYHVNLADINVGSALMDVSACCRRRTRRCRLRSPCWRAAWSPSRRAGGHRADTSVIDIIAAHVKRARAPGRRSKPSARVRLDRGDVRAGRVRLPTQASHTLDMIDRGQVRVGADLGIPHRCHRRALLRQRHGGYGAHLRRVVHRIEPACHHEHAPAVFRRAPAGRAGLRGARSSSAPTSCGATSSSATGKERRSCNREKQQLLVLERRRVSPNREKYDIITIRMCLLTL